MAELRLTPHRRTQFGRRSCSSRSSGRWSTLPLGLASTEQGSSSYDLHRRSQRQRRCRPEILPLPIGRMTVQSMKPMSRCRGRCRRKPHTQCTVDVPRLRFMPATLWPSDPGGLPLVGSGQPAHVMGQRDVPRGRTGPWLSSCKAPHCPAPRPPAGSRSLNKCPAAIERLDAR